MNDLIIKSSSSDLALILSDYNGQYFNVRLESTHLKTIREGVYAYTDGPAFASLIEHLASQEKPWMGNESWESLEGEFKFTASCGARGDITFRIELS